MLENFGARLRQRRVEQGISLNAIAQQTKIKLSLLEGLERDDVSRWPTGIFRRAYIRAYAQAIGLDPDVVVREFLAVHPEPAEVFTAALESALAADRARLNSSTPGRLRDIVGSALGSLSLFRRSPAAPPQPPTDTDTSDFDALDAEEVAVTYPSSELAWVETADDAGVEAPVLERPAHQFRRVVISASPPEGDAEQVENPVVTSDPVQADSAGPIASPPGESPVAGPADERPPAYPDLFALARLCTGFGRIATAEDLAPLLNDAAGLLKATGLIVWMWDESVEGLRPVLAHGYSEKVLAHLPTVSREADNPTAAAFRSAETCAIDGTGDTSGALVVPLMTQAGCAGVLAIELQPGVKQTDAVSAIATILAALLAQLIARAYAAEVEAEPEMSVAPVEEIASQAPRTRFAY